jgi:hypothetical protein
MNASTRAAFSSNHAGVKLWHGVMGYAAPLAASQGVEGLALQKTAELVKKWAETVDVEETLIMGDFRPGNILVDLASGPGGSVALKKVWILDWGMCRYAFPAIDIGFFAGGACWLAAFGKWVAGETLRSCLLSEYANRMDVEAGLRLGARSWRRVRWIKCIWWQEGLSTSEKE